MGLTEDQIIENYGKCCGHCNQIILLPYENEWNCLSCGFNLTKRKHDLSKIQRKKKKFIIRLKYAEQEILCICVEV